MESGLKTFRAEVLTVAEHNGLFAGRSETARFVIDVFETILLSFILFFAINAVSARIRVDGYSMEPTLHTGEFVVVNKLTNMIGDYERGCGGFSFPAQPGPGIHKTHCWIAGRPGGGQEW